MGVSSAGKLAGFTAEDLVMPLELPDLLSLWYSIDTWQD